MSAPSTMGPKPSPFVRELDDPLLATTRSTTSDGSRSLQVTTPVLEPRPRSPSQALELSATRCTSPRREDAR